MSVQGTELIKLIIDQESELENTKTTPDNTCFLNADDLEALRASEKLFVKKCVLELIRTHQFDTILQYLPANINFTISQIIV